MKIEENKKKTGMTQITPNYIFVYMALWFICTLIPFLRSPALRLVGYENNEHMPWISGSGGMFVNPDFYASSDLVEIRLHAENQCPSYKREFGVKVRTR